MYLDLASFCLTLAALGVICMGLTFVKAFIDVYIFKKCSCEKEYDGRCIGGCQDY